MIEAVSNSSYPDSSGALLSGVPSVVAYYENLIDNIDDIVSEATTSALTRYQKSVQRTAKRQGWGDKAQSIDVRFDPENVEVILSGDATMEYGTGPEPARPALRASLGRVESLEKMIEKEMKKRFR